MFSKHLMICIAILLLSGAMADLSYGESAQNVSLEIVNGVIHIKNPTQPANPVQTLQLRELWRIGDDLGEGDDTIGFITDILVDEQDNSYLLDSSYNVIRVYSPTGSHLRDIGGEGEGPGEFRMATDFVFLPNGTIGVVQVMPAKVITLDRQGVPGKRFALCENDHGMSKIERAQSAGNNLVIGMMKPNFSANAVEHIIAFHDTRGQLLQKVVHETEVQAGGSLNIGGIHAFEFTRFWALGASGHVFVAPRKDAYEIEVYNASGVLERVIERKYESVKRSKKELAADRKRTEELAARFGGMVILETKEYERDIKVMFPRENGELWVLSSQGTRDCPKGAVGTFDVIDAKGLLNHQLSLAVDYNAKRDDFLIFGDRLYVLKEAQARPTSTSFDTGGGVSSISVIGGGGVDEDEEDNDGEPVPAAVICYQLPTN